MPSTTMLSAAAADRKARLAQLKNLKRKLPSDSADNESHASNNDDAGASRPSKSPRISASEDVEDVSAGILSGRNYDPLTKGPRLGFESDPLLSAGAVTVEKRAQALADEVKSQLELERAEAEAEEAAEAEGQGQGQQLDLFKLRPKKPNWDLKQRLEERMRPVEVRTENAIARLVRERIEGKKKEQEEKRKAEGGPGGSAARTAGGEEGEDGEIGIEGSALVEATKEREREAEEDARRDREAEAELEEP